MDLENIFEKKYEDLEKKLNVKTKVLSYLINSIEKEYKEILPVFYPTIKKEFAKEFGRKFDFEAEKSFFLEKVYLNYFKMIKELDEEFSDVLKINYYPEKEETFDIKLGLTNYFFHRPTDSIRKKLTKKGTNTVNSYRAAAELEPLEEAIRKQRESLEHMYSKASKISRRNFVF